MHYNYYVRDSRTGLEDPASAGPKIQNLFLKIIIINLKPTIDSNLVAISA